MHFKGWAIPGPKISPNPSLVAEEGETLDALCGHYKIFQLKDGHRYSTDDVLTAWYGSSISPSPKKILELGSGIGTVGMIAAWKFQGASLVAIEAQEDSIRLAKKSSAYNGLADRHEIRAGDFRGRSLVGTDERFDLIFGTPPYFPLGSGVLGNHPQKVACRFEVRGSIQDYCEVAARHLATGGVFACVFPISPEHQEVRVMAAIESSGLRLIRRRNIVLREGEPPLLGLFAMTKKEDLPSDLDRPIWKEPDLLIREKSGKVHPEYLSIKLSIGFPPTG